ncbi:MAG: PAS domain S-box protein, partial [Candidatus Methanoperedens sp.]|nr:PAS domain S-box protein [Candidatus Methanoperedens sp.]
MKDSESKSSQCRTAVSDITEHRQIDKVLEDSEERYRELAESIGEVFYAMDRELRYTYWNTASEALTGILAKDAIGKSLFELFPELKETRAEKFYRKVLKTHQPERFVNKYRVKGKVHFFEINVYPSKFG